MCPETLIHHEFLSSVEVELIIDSGNGDITVQSVEFDIVDDEGGLVVPREAIPTDYHDRIVTHLEETGYSIKKERTPA